MLRLLRASSEQEALTQTRFMEFIDAHPNPFVTTRPEDVIRSAIRDESIFFVEEPNGEIAACTGFYRHGSLWAELGSTLVDERFTGCGLQRVIYHHILTLKWLGDWPRHVIAIVDENAIASYKNIERCGFKQLQDIPQALKNATPGRDWTPVSSKRKRLYHLDSDGVAASLLFAAQNGRNNTLVSKDGTVKHSLLVEFPHLAKQEFLDVLRAEAEMVRDMNESRVIKP